MSPKLQVKLLRVLQEGEFERVGESRTIRVDTRVVAASNQLLEDEIDAGRLTLLNLGIGAAEGIAELWVNERSSSWSSFSRDVAGRDGSPCRALPVQRRRFAAVLAEHGVPYYLVDDNGDGTWSRQQPTDSGVRVPRWVVHSW